MAFATLRSEERIGLALAIAAHVALFAWLALKPPAPAPVPVPERMTVTLSDDVGLTSTSPEPQAAPAPDTAPVFGENTLPPTLKPEPQPEPAPLAPARQSVKAPAVEPATPAPKSALPTKPAGASRIGSDFLKGVAGASTRGKAQNPPAATIGPAVQSALAGAISRQLKPKWVAPQGADAEKLVTVLAWDLNPDGSLAGSPQVVRQEGITDANRAQAQRHAEQAIRAVRLAAPFDLPAEYYAAWKRIASFRFDRKLSQ